MSQTEAAEEDIMRENMINLFSEVFNCQQVIKEFEKAYEFRMITMDHIQGILK